MEETRNENGQENSNEKVNERKHGIVVEHVYKSFGKEHVLVDVNLEIPRERSTAWLEITEAEKLC